MFVCVKVTSFPWSLVSSQTWKLQVLWPILSCTWILLRGPIIVLVDTANQTSLKFVVRVIQHKILIYVNFITPLRICTDQQGVIDLVIAIDFSFPLNSVLDWICLLSLCTSLFNTFCPLTDKTVGKISSLQERERRTSTSSTMSTTSQVRQISEGSR